MTGLGLGLEFPIVRDQRFFPCRLNKLLDYDNVTVQDYLKKMNGDSMNIAADLIKNVDYPLYLGQPDDSHVYLAYPTIGIMSMFGSKLFKYKYCVMDYWDTAEEIIDLKVGDCDASVAFTSCMLALGHIALEVFGVVYDEAGNVLGGHAWSYSTRIPDEKLRYYEFTLDEVPPEYPVVDDPLKELRFNGLVLKPDVVFDDKNYYQPGDPILTKDREKLAKYQAIEKAFKVKTKPIAKRDKSWLARRRWKA